MYHHKFKQFMADVKTNPIKEINGHQVDVKLALDCDDEVGISLTESLHHGLFFNFITATGYYMFAFGM
jgi:hypothetical protein